MEYPIFQILPNEIQYLLSDYLDIIDYYHLSQVSSSLRRIFHPLLYASCIVCDEYGIYNLSTGNTSEIVFSLPEKALLSHYRWPVPRKAFYSPSKYSWFLNESVKVVAIHKLESPTIIANGISMSNYPNLQSIIVIPDNYTNVVLTKCDEKVLSEDIPDRYKVLYLRDLYAVAKSPSNLINARNLNALKSTESSMLQQTFIFNCLNMESKHFITRLLVNLINSGSKKEFNLCVSLISLDTFPNLKDLQITSCSDISYKGFERIIKSLPRCTKLEKLCIYHFIRQNILHPEKLLDNITGNWKSFVLRLSTNNRFDFKLRLPCVTELEICPTLQSYSNIEFGPIIKYFSTHLEVDGIPISDGNVQQLLEQLSVLSVKLSPRCAAKTIHALSKHLPNLKTLNVTHISTNACRYMNVEIPNNFKLMMNQSNFGEFDLLNIKHMNPLISSIAEKCANDRIGPKRVEFDFFFTQEVVIDANLIVERLKTAIQDSNLQKTCEFLFDLLFEYFVRIDSFLQPFYKNERIFSSLLFDMIEKYIPNLEVLNIKNLSSIEEYPTLHHLIKHKKSLKKIHFENLYFHPVSLPDTYDRFFHRFSEFTSSWYDSQRSESNSIMNRNNYTIDMEGIHNDYHNFGALSLLNGANEAESVSQRISRPLQFFYQLEPSNTPPNLGIHNFTNDPYVSN